MSTDDRDIESGNPSKSFTVGEFDRLSGFFTPVWESKRRLRAESPLAGSSAAARAGAGAGSERGPATPAAQAASGEASSEGGSEGAADAGASGRPAPAPTQAAAASAAGDAASVPAASVPLAVPSALRDAALTRLNPTGTLRGVAVPGVAARRAPGSSPAAAARGSSAPASAPAPGSERAGEGPSRPDPVASALAAAAAVTVRPVIPMPQTPGRVPVRSKTPAPERPAPADRPAPSPPEESRPEQQEARPSSPALSAPSGRSWAQRSERAAAAARAVHHALETRRSSEPSDETFRRHRETESEREASLFAAAQAANAPVDAQPSHVLRTLRRTFHLSTPLPEPVQRMLDKHRR